MLSETRKKTVAILQSSYIPWKGYFDMIRSVDEFILYDEVQYTKRDWRNRNLIKTPQGTQWLTIPVEVKGKYFQPICDVIVADHAWADNHWKNIAFNYAKAPYFKEYRTYIEELYQEVKIEQYLSHINYRFIKSINQLLGIKTKLSWSSDYVVEKNDKTRRLIELCTASEANCYLSGPAAKTYLDEAQFKQANIELLYMNYDHYPMYPQLFGDFDHCVTILDLIFNMGPNAMAYIERGCV